jgi:hypothetical protein
MRMIDSARHGANRPGRWLTLWLLILGGAAAALLVWQGARFERAPDKHRVEMYQRTLESVRTTCFPPKAGVESYCRDQALLLLEFPECDPSCVSLARKVRGEPTR